MMELWNVKKFADSSDLTTVKKGEIRVNAKN